MKHSDAGGVSSQNFWIARLPLRNIQQNSTMEEFGVVGKFMVRSRWRILRLAPPIIQHKSTMEEFVIVEKFMVRSRQQAQ
jgi:hypothetical protein